MFFKNVRNNRWITILLIVLVSFIHHACNSSEDYDNSSFLNETKSVLGNSDRNSFVVAGNAGTILTSSDGTSWTSRTSGTSNNLRLVTFANSTFVVVGYGGIIQTSSNNGISWMSSIKVTNNRLWGVSYSE